MKKHYLILIATLLSNASNIEAIAGKIHDENPGTKSAQHRSPQVNTKEEEENQNQGDENPYTAHLVGPIKLTAQDNRAEAKFELRSPHGKEVIPHTVKNLRVEINDFEFTSEPDMGLLDPRQALPTHFDFGAAQKKVHYEFEYKGHLYEDEIVDTFTRAYKHEQPQWVCHNLNQEDLDLHRTRFDLVLKVPLENHTTREVKFSKTLDHELDQSSIGNVLPGNHYYDGETVSFRYYKPAQWKAPRLVGQPVQIYDGLIMDASEGIPSHRGSEIVFTEVIPIPGERLPDTYKGYKGDYNNISRTLAPEHIQGKLAGQHLIYSDGTDIFYPKITHELWERDGWRVGFGIASYHQDGKIEFLPEARFPNERKLEKGLYRLFSISESQGDRNEIWRRLGKDPLDIEITMPKGIASIPGFMTRYVAPWN